MTFWALVAAVCLSVYFLTLVCGLLLVRILSAVLIERLLSSSPKSAANFLFSLRVFPFALAIVASAGLALPAFLRFEPRITSEGLGWRLWLLSILGVAVLGTKIFRALRILRSTMRCERRWLQESTEIPESSRGSRIPIHCVNEASSLLAVTGVFRSRLFVSRQVIQLLSADEFSAALAHELAHIGRFDNLKQWILKITGPPRWLDAPAMSTTVWTNVCETAADERALDNGVSALDLASALLKVAQLKCLPATGDPVVCHLLPDLPGSSLGGRIARLQESIERPVRTIQPGSRRRLKMFLLIASPLMIYAACLSVLLPFVHDVLELLVR